MTKNEIKHFEKFIEWRKGADVPMPNPIVITKILNKILIEIKHD